MLPAEARPLVDDVDFLEVVDQNERFPDSDSITICVRLVVSS